MKNFRTYEIAVTFYRLAVRTQITGHLRDQLLRAASSVVLNLAEGYGRISRGDQVRFFKIALGSLRECQAVLTLSLPMPQEPAECADKLAAHLYLLIKNAKH